VRRGSSSSVLAGTEPESRRIHVNALELVARPAAIGRRVKVWIGTRLEVSPRGTAREQTAPGMCIGGAGCEIGPIERLEPGIRGLVTS
jgi:hypothetical protein